MTSAKDIVDAIDYNRSVGIGKYPEIGQYVITSIQAGNLQGEQGWEKYIGYCVQVRKEAGSFGSHLVLLRHPDGSLMQHHNQCFYTMNDYWLEKAKGLFEEGVTPDEMEDYTQAYTLGSNKYPEIGKVIEPKDDGPPQDNSPMMKMTVKNGDGNTSVHVM